MLHSSCRLAPILALVWTPAQKFLEKPLYTVMWELSQGRIKIWSGTEARAGWVAPGLSPAVPTSLCTQGKHLPASTALHSFKERVHHDSAPKPDVAHLALPLGLIWLCCLPQILPGSGWKLIQPKTWQMELVGEINPQISQKGIEMHFFCLNSTWGLACFPSITSHTTQRLPALYHGPITFSTLGYTQRT